MTVDELQQVWDEADLLASETDVDQAVDRMAIEMQIALADKKPLLLCVMNGGLMLSGMLMRRLPFVLEVDYLHATRYREQTQGSDTLEWRALPQKSLEGRCVVVIDDILDEGHTLAAIVRACEAQGAAEVLTAVLVDKQHDRRTADITKADFTGMQLEDRYIFGCGMDYKGFWRNLPAIYAVKGL